MKHLHKIKPTFISIFSLNIYILICLSYSKLLKNSAYGLVFQHTSRYLDNLMKHSSSCLIYYIIVIILWNVCPVWCELFRCLLITPLPPYKFFYHIWNNYKIGREEKWPLHWGNGQKKGWYLVFTCTCTNFIIPL